MIYDLFTFFHKVDSYFKEEKNIFKVSLYFFIVLLRSVGSERLRLDSQHWFLLSRTWYDENDDDVVSLMKHTHSNKYVLIVLLVK